MHEKEELVKLVLDWWKKHQDDYYQQDVGDGLVEEFSTYPIEPDFVTYAKSIAGEE